MRVCVCVGAGPGASGRCGQELFGGGDGRKGGEGGGEEFQDSSREGLQGGHSKTAQLLAIPTPTR